MFTQRHLTVTEEDELERLMEFEVPDDERFHLELPEEIGAYNIKRLSVDYEYPPQILFIDEDTHDCRCVQGRTVFSARYTEALLDYLKNGIYSSKYPPGCPHLPSRR